MTDATSSIPSSTYIIGGLSFAVLAGLTYYFLEGNKKTESSKPISESELDELVSSAPEEKKRRNQKKNKPTAPIKKEERKSVETPKKEETKEQPKKEETKKEGKKNKKKKGNQQQKKEPAKPLDLLANKITGDDEGEWEEVGKKGTDKKKSYKDTQKKAKELYNSYLENF